MTLCKLGLILAAAEADGEREILYNAILDEKRWPSKSLSVAIKSTGTYSVGATTIKDHRNQKCGCYNGNS